MYDPVDINYTKMLCINIQISFLLISFFDRDVFKRNHPLPRHSVTRNLCKFFIINDSKVLLYCSCCYCSVWVFCFLLNCLWDTRISCQNDQQLLSEITFINVAACCCCKAVCD